MGLWITIRDNEHEKVFQASYMTFDILRRAICEACGGSWSPHDIRLRLTNGFSKEELSGLERERWYWDSEYSPGSHPGLYEFLCHSDCDGEMSWELAGKLAEELFEVRKKSSILNEDRFKDMVDNLISGCRKSFLLEKDLLFY